MVDIDPARDFRPTREQMAAERGSAVLARAPEGADPAVRAIERIDALDARTSTKLDALDTRVAIQLDKLTTRTTRNTRLLVLTVALNAVVVALAVAVAIIKIR